MQYENLGPVLNEDGSASDITRSMFKRPSKNEIKAMAIEAYEVQGNLEDAMMLLEDWLNDFEMEEAEDFLIEKYGEPEGW